MNFQVFTIAACCGNTSTIFKTSRPIMVSDISDLVKLGFTESVNFSKAGILYVDSAEITISGPLGSDRLQVRCKVKKADCPKAISDFEKILEQLQ